MNRLNKDIIRTHINNDVLRHPIHIYSLDTVDSTNRFIKDLPSREGLTLCCAETQTHGRGRFGRKWHSPSCENIYASLRIKFNHSLSKLSGLSLVTSLAIIKTLNELGLQDDLKVKWPNDILWQGKKLSGCLIELMTLPNQHAELIIGIGLNVNSHTANHPLPDKSWCSLLDITGKLHDRNLIIGKLINHFFQSFEQLLLTGFEGFAEQWERVDALKGQFITLSQQNELIHGQANGVNSIGQLILIDNNENIHYFSSGDTSLSSIAVYNAT